MTQFGGPPSDPAGHGTTPSYGAPPTPPPAGYTAPPPGQGGAPGYGAPTGYGAPAGPNAAGGAPPAQHPQEVSDAGLAHYLGIIGWIGPLIIMLTKAKDSPHVRAHSVEALNFAISMTIYTFAAIFVLGCLAIFTFGLSLFGLFVPLVLQIIFPIMGGNAAKQGGFYRYPITIRMVS